MTPAEYVIQRFGGIPGVAKALGLSRAAVWKWNKPEDEGGAGGRVPGKHHRKIIKIAENRGIRIRASELIFGKK